MEERKPKLHDIEAFRRVLANYHVSDHARNVLDGMTLVAVSGLAGGGRNTVINRLVARHNYFFLISDTTRPPKVRNGELEQDGVQYYFRSEADMLQDIQNGEFLEAEIIHNQQVSGTSIRELERAKDSGQIGIHDFEFGGANNVAAAKPDAYIIGLLPPSYDEWLRRFKGREEIHEEEFLNRMHTAEKVLENMLAKPYFKFVINDDIDACVERIHAIVAHNEYSDDLDTTGRRVAVAILQEVKKTLREHQGQNHGA